MSLMSNNKPIGLTELIYRVKRELMQPEQDGADPVPLLAVDEVELRIAVKVSKKAQAGLNIQVVELGGGGEHSDVHTVRVKLTPLLTRQERLANLRRDPRWDEVVRQQVEATLKGFPEESLKEQY